MIQALSDVLRPCRLLALLGVSLSAQPFLYVAKQIPGTVPVINTRTNAVTASINAAFSPDGIAISQDGTRAYVTQVQVLNNIGTGQQNPIGIVVSPNGQRVYIAKPISGNATSPKSFFDTRTIRARARTLSLSAKEIFHKSQGN